MWLREQSLLLLVWSLPFWCPARSAGPICISWVLLGPPGLYWDSALCLFLDLHSQSLLWQFARVKFLAERTLSAVFPETWLPFNSLCKMPAIFAQGCFRFFPLVHFHSSLVSSQFWDLPFFPLEFDICL